MPEELKYNKWVFTVNANNKGDLPSDEVLMDFFIHLCAKWGYQKEKVTREHIQGWMVTKIRKRKSTVLNEFSNWLEYQSNEYSRDMITINQMMGTVEQNELYCQKTEGAIGPYHTSEVIYSGKDISVLDLLTNRYPWQDAVYNIIFDDHGLYKEPDDRSVYYITDPKGGNGKSLLVKWICVNNHKCVKLSFGSTQQLRSSIVGLGPRKCYFIDIPRTIGDEDSLKSVFSVIEELKLGFVSSNLYGQHAQLVQDPPHIIVFSNSKCPEKLLSADRWREYFISADKKLQKLPGSRDYYDNAVDPIVQD